MDDGYVAGTAPLRYGEVRARWVLMATVLGSGMAFLDATVVNIALPAIGSEFGADVAGLQWTVNAYTLTLAAFILLGGSAGDRFGRRRMFLVGAVWFAVASLLCGLAPNVEVLVGARALQGIGGALLTPGSLAILQASFREADRGRAIGAWSGLGGVAGAVGPFLGGWLVDSASWRLVFLINVPLAVVVVLTTLRYVPETSDPQASRRFDVTGAVLCAVTLAALTYGLVGWGARGLVSPHTWAPLLLGVAAGVTFVQVERISAGPMLPLGVFASGLFRAVNLVTFVVYAALAGIFFMLVITLQVVSGFSPTLAGSALLPVTALMLLLSARAGELGQRIGPRLPMTIGCLLSASGVLLLARVDAGSSYLVDVLPGTTLLGLGLSATVAPLTASVLASAPARHVGVASGVNNAVARSAGLLLIAALPAMVGLSGDAYADPGALERANRLAMWWCTGLLLLGAALSFFLVRSGTKTAEPGSVPGAVHCSVDAPPLRGSDRRDTSS